MITSKHIGPCHFFLTKTQNIGPTAVDYVGLMSKVEFEDTKEVTIICISLRTDNTMAKKIK